MVPELFEPSPISSIAPPGPTVVGLVEITATGAPCIVTVANAGALCTPRLSVTTSENVTVPDVLGTVTATIDVGAPVVTLGLLGDRGVVPAIGGKVIGGTGPIGGPTGGLIGPIGSTGPTTGPFTGPATSPLVSLGDGMSSLHVC